MTKNGQIARHEGFQSLRFFKSGDILQGRYAVSKLSAIPKIGLPSSQSKANLHSMRGTKYIYSKVCVTTQQKYS